MNQFSPLQQHAVNIKFLRQLPLLSVMDDSVFARFIQFTRLSHFPRHTVLIHKNQPADWLGIILRGQLQLEDHLPGGGEVILDLVHAGQSVGETSLIDRSPPRFTARAMVAADVLIVSGQAMRELFFRYPPMSEAVQKRLVGHLHRAMQQRTVLAIPQPARRLYALLDFLAMDKPSGLREIEVLPTHSELAQMLGTSRETVSRALSAVMGAGIVEKDSRRLILRQSDLLKKWVTGEESSH